MSRAYHSTRSKDYMGQDARNSNQGRPPIEHSRTLRERDTEPPAGDLLRPRTRVWVEGEIVLAEWDFEGHDLKDTLPALLAQLSNRPDETGKPRAWALRLSEQVLPNDYDENTGKWNRQTLPRKYAQRRERRWGIDEIYTYICANPGKTIDELCAYFYADSPEPQRHQPKLRVALNKLQRKGQVEYRKISGKPSRWYGDESWNPDWSACTKAFATELAKRFGGEPAQYAEDAKALQNVVTCNAREPDLNKWVHPDDAPF